MLTLSAELPFAVRYTNVSYADEAVVQKNRAMSALRGKPSVA